MNTSHTHHDEDFGEEKVQKYTNILVYATVVAVMAVFLISPNFTAALPSFFAIIWMAFAWGFRRAAPLSLPMSLACLVYVLALFLILVLPSWQAGDYSVWWL